MVIPIEDNPRFIGKNDYRQMQKEISVKIHIEKCKKCGCTEFVCEEVREHIVNIVDNYNGFQTAILEEKQPSTLYPGGDYYCRRCGEKVSLDGNGAMCLLSAFNCD